MEQVFPTYKKHVLVCCNTRENKSCCANVGGMEIFQKVKEFVMMNNLTTQVWVTKTGCLGFCNDEGTTVVIYPEKVWFPQVKVKDIPELCQMIKKGW